MSGYVPTWLRGKQPATTTAAPPAAATAQPKAAVPAPSAAAPSYVPRQFSPYNPSKQAPVYTPPPPPPSQGGQQQQKPKSGISVTNTSNNAISSFHDKPMVSPYTAFATPTHSHHPHPSPSRSPVIAKRIPTRMSPAITPHSSSMNPAAPEFFPSGHDGLEALPISTADMNNEEGPKSTPYRPPGKVYRRSVNNPSAAPYVPSAALMNLINSKSSEEIRAISQKSTLSTNAPAYDMNRRTMTRVVLQPSPLSLRPTSPTEEPEELEGGNMPLDEVWSLYYLPLHGEHIKEETYNPTLVFRIDSIPTFWKVVNNIPIPTKLPYCTLYMFRDGIDPRWEDAANREGGIVRLKINHNRSKTFNTLSPTDRVEKGSDCNVNEAWELLMCRTIGDSWSPEVRDTVNGIALKVRERSYMMEVWVTKQTPTISQDLAQLLQPTLGNVFAVTYLSHKSQQERSQQIEEMAKQQEHMNRKRNKKY